MELVVNEWLPEYICPDAPDDKKELAEQFLNTFMQRSDKIFVKDPSPFLNKIYRFQKQFDYDLKTRETYKAFVKYILRNTEKCNIVLEEELKDLPEITVGKLNETGTNFNSDTYLFEAANLTEDRIIITTDIKLKNQMESDENFQVVLLEEFLENYTTP